jgi:hypothetical protein
VPGGVGPMTVAMLMHNTLLNFQRHVRQTKNGATKRSKNNVTSERDYDQ